MYRLLSLVLLFAMCTPKKAYENAEEETDWDYQSENIDAYWSSLSRAYRPCQDGKHQSPINIISSIQGTHDLNVRYTVSHESIENNGHTVLLEYDSGSYLGFDGRQYQLLQFHFHTPSEHYLSGEQFPLEVHLVHASNDTVYLVYSLLFKEGSANSFIESFLMDIPDVEGQKVEKDQKIAVSALADHATEYYMYEGSFTTPPCTEGVKWIIAAKAMEVSADQIQRIQSIEGMNARQPHELFDREVERF